MKEHIKHAAVKADCGYTLFGKSHSECFHQGYYSGIVMSKRALDQGFITSKGRYVDREEGFKIADKAKQIENRKGAVLCSEDLWSPRHGGKFKYSYIKGYEPRTEKREMSEESKK